MILLFQEKEAASESVMIPGAASFRISLQQREFRITVLLQGKVILNAR